MSSQRWLHNSEAFKNRTRRHRLNHRKTRPRPQFERLEDRSLLAAWNLETVQDVPLNSCQGAYVTGFEYDPANRPVVGFNVDNGCTTGGTIARWARKDTGVWSSTQLVPTAPVSPRRRLSRLPCWPSTIGPASPRVRTKPYRRIRDRKRSPAGPRTSRRDQLDPTSFILKHYPVESHPAMV